MDLFGSYARGEQNKVNDVDILVELEKPIGLKFFKLWDKLESILGVKVDLLTVKSGKAKAKAVGKHKGGPGLCLRGTGGCS